MSEVKQRIKELFKGKYPQDTNGLFYDEIFPDRYDKISEDDLRKIFNSKNPEEAFDEWMLNTYIFYEQELSNNAFDSVWNDEVIKEYSKNKEQPEFEIRLMFNEMFYIKLPYEYFMNQLVCVDLIVDTGDGNYDYSINQPFASWNDQNATKIEDESALLWLAKQQGYSKGQLTKALCVGETGGSKFLKSVRQEVQNVTTGMNCLVFLVRIPLKSLLNLNFYINQEKPLNNEYHPHRSKGRGYLIIDANTQCGLYDPWNGAGGTLEIALEKSVKLPFHFIDSAKPDGCRGYKVSEIYGVSESFWSKDSIKEIHPMKKLEVES